ncbi:MAG TPA: phosphoribosylanthranilate isomerase [Bacteroidales bacterium]|nr:phosphoribosylanthranilate isomerase [Bacteroidales bacterium]
MGRIRIKICCISSIEEAGTAIELGADAIGLVGRMPSGPGPISDELIRKIARSVPPLTGTFLLTSEVSAGKIIEHHKRTQTSTIQIVDILSDGTYSQIKEALPPVKIVQVIHVIDSASVEQAIRLSENVDALLLDSGNPNLKIKELGGTGRVHNWTLSRQIRDNAKCPVILAGGLNPENVSQAIEAVDPFGIDVCSGVRTDGRLDREKLSRFIRNATNKG